MQILIYGYGNPGRQDDGLGIAFTRQIEEWVAEQGFEGFEFESNYQLNIEDAEAISHKDLVIFADASEEEIEDFCLSRVDGNTNVSFTTHSASPGYILQLCRELFMKEPIVFLLHIKGYEWEFSEGLSDRANKNLDKAVIYMMSILERPDMTLDSTGKLKLC